VVDHGDAVFWRDSPVLEYWLARCDGFAIRRGRRAVGEVQGVATQDDFGRAELLRVRSLSRKKLLPAGQVAAVVPSRRLLILDEEETAVGRSARAVLDRRHHVVHGARLLAAQRRWVGGAARSVYVRRHGVIRVAVASWLTARPHLVAAARATARIAAELTRLTVLGLHRGAAWLDRELRRVTPIAIAASERAIARLGRATVTASRTGAEIARSLTSEMRERTRH
jgi:hypothetical protein